MGTVSSLPLQEMESLAQRMLALVKAQEQNSTVQVVEQHLEGNATQETSASQGQDHVAETVVPGPASEAALEPVTQKQPRQAALLPAGLIPGWFECEVCFEHKLFAKDRLPLKEKRTLNGDVLRKSDCNHDICSKCMASFVAARVEERRVFDIRCPHEGCTNELYESDVADLQKRGDLAESVMNQFVSLRAEDYQQRVKSLREDFFEGYEDCSQLWRDVPRGGESCWTRVLHRRSRCKAARHPSRRSCRTCQTRQEWRSGCHRCHPCCPSEEQDTEAVSI